MKKTEQKKEKRKTLKLQHKKYSKIQDVGNLRDSTPI